MRISDWSSDVCSSDLGSDAGEGHRALPTVHAHVGDRRQILPGGVGNPCADIDLARVGVEPGDQGIEVTRRGDTDGVADSGRGYALFGRPARIGPDHQLGTLEACGRGARSEEHTSELQSLMRISYAVFCLKKKNTR